MRKKTKKKLLKQVSKNLRAKHKQANSDILESVGYTNATNNYILWRTRKWNKKKEKNAKE